MTVPDGMHLEENDILSVDILVTNEQYQPNCETVSDKIEGHSIIHLKTVKVINNAEEEKKSQKGHTSTIHFMQS